MTAMLQLIRKTTDSKKIKSWNENIHQAMESSSWDDVILYLSTCYRFNNSAFMSRLGSHWLDSTNTYLNLFNNLIDYTVRNNLALTATITRDFTSTSDLTKQWWIDCGFTALAMFMGPTWGPSGSCRSQMDPMLAPWSLLLGGLFPTISVARVGNRPH